jgi:hypothetical protein
LPAGALTIFSRFSDPGMLAGRIIVLTATTYENRKQYIQSIIKMSITG